MPSLQVSPRIAFLKQGQNSILPVLRWDITGAPSAYFWYKKNNQGAWKAAIYDTDDGGIPHKFSSPTDSSELGQRNGTKDKEWTTGHYVFIGFSDRSNPNDNPSLDDPSPFIRAELFILRDQTVLLQNTSEDWGNTGTQINAYAHGVPNGAPTYAVLRVDTMEPQHPAGTVTGASGGDPYPPSWLDFPDLSPTSPDYVPPLEPPQRVETSRSLLDHNPVAIVSTYFLPGQPYWALLLVYTEDGKWQFKKKQLTMWKRAVEITFVQISISNDGAKGDGEAYFHWWVVDRDIIARAYRTGTIPISDRPSPGEEWKEHIGLSTYIPEEDTPALKLGPYAVTDAKFNRCLILTRAIGKRGFPHHDDKSGNVKFELGAAGTAAPDDLPEDVPLDFPAGADVESFENARFFVQAENVNDDDDDNEFAYEIRGVYSVSYAP